MVTFTPILKLAMPIFDQDPWDEEINNNMQILDSTIGSFFGIANYIGIWRNSTPYTIGHVVTDTQNGSMWSCAVAHTSAAAPTTFAEDRIARPGLWIQEIANASDLAQQAANSATASATSASAAAASAATINNALPLAGGTMTGYITLHAGPINALHPATKAYVDAQVGGVSFLPLTGGNITGNLGVSGDLSVSGISFLGNRIRAYTAGLNPVVFGYRDGFGGGGFFVNSDGTIYFSTIDVNGSATFNRASLTPAGQFRAVVSVAAPLLYSEGNIQWHNGASTLYSDATRSGIQFTVDGWRLEFNRTNGDLDYFNNSSTALVHTTSAGVIHSKGFSTTDSIFGSTVQGNYLRSFGAANIDGAFVVGGTTSLSGLVTANNIHTGGMTAANITVTNSIAVANSFTVNGNATVVGSITTTALQNNSNINTATLSCSGLLSCGSLSVSGAFGIGGTFSAGHVSASGSVTGSYIQSSGDVRALNDVIAENLAYKPGGGTWSDLSDERVKTVDSAYTSGLAELIQLTPVRYRYNNNLDREHIGLVAQQAELIMPELVKQRPGVVDGVSIPDLRELDATAIIFAAINALKEVNTELAECRARLDVLEAA